MTSASRGPARRPWSARRGPAAVLALLGATACGMLLYDQVALHYGRPAAPWRSRTEGWLTDTPGTSGWVIGAAAALALLGLYLMVLALTPGGRRRLPMAPAAPAVRAVLDRASAVTLLRDAALQVPGVTNARARMRGRRRAVIRVTVAYGESTTIRAALHEALATETDRLGLAKPPRLRLGLTTGAPTHLTPTAAQKPPPITATATGTATGTGTDTGTAQDGAAENDTAQHRTEQQ
ncbi:DUF6286 domain-containing protein [Streptomyces zagrosensis]|uniref:DUF6286 domain-containing protein n=1 Tax=Streptomyces zagrosensis TaxID=1042984 RepID=A0A7W9Q621_9ACTN|nr:DUF6286 domain-containing protein [Streptomyces zagrosensis]MBB5933778.1 hypothetical protein [Streptomyces zagrosensis]